MKKSIVAFVATTMIAVSAQSVVLIAGGIYTLGAMLGIFGGITTYVLVTDKNGNTTKKAKKVDRTEEINFSSADYNKMSRALGWSQIWHSFKTGKEFKPLKREITAAQKDILKKFSGTKISDNVLFMRVLEVAAKPSNNKYTPELAEAARDIAVREPTIDDLLGSEKRIDLRKSTEFIFAMMQLCDARPDKCPTLETQN